MTLPDESQRGRRGSRPSGAGAPRRRSVSRERRHRVRRRRAAAALALIALIVVATVLLAGGSSGVQRSRSYAKTAGKTTPATGTRVTSTASHAPGSSGAASVPAHPADPSGGSLPQTQAVPSADTARFKSRMAAFWEGVTRNSVTPARPAFFPRAAYVQLKAIGGAGSDWRYRLLHDYALDLEAAHHLLGSGASQAQLIGVRVVSSYGHWVPPGVCYNDVGYYEVPNARVVYRENGQVRSFGIASMISWRGEWYVVHLGAVLREGESGVVDEPASGTGESAYSGTC